MKDLFTTASANVKTGQNLQQGGGSPSKPTDMQRLTGTILTVRGDHYLVPFPESIRRIEMALGSGPAGVDRSSPEMRTKLGSVHCAGLGCCEYTFPTKHHLQTAVESSDRFTVFLQPGGGSPSMPIDMQRLTGTVLTVRALPPVRHFRDQTAGLKCRTGGGPLELTAPVPRYERSNTRD